MSGFLKFVIAIALLIGSCVLIFNLTDLNIDCLLQQHEYQIVEGKPSTCSEEGYAEYSQCIHCNAKKDYVISPTLEHDMEEIASVSATCEAEGARTLQCKGCGEETTETEGALGHKWSDWEEPNGINCADGYTANRTCLRCDENETKEISAKGHTFLNGSCSSCGVTLTVEGLAQKQTDTEGLQYAVDMSLDAVKKDGSSIPCLKASFSIANMEKTLTGNEKLGVLFANEKFLSNITYKDNALSNTIDWKTLISDDFVFVEAETNVQAANVECFLELNVLNVRTSYLPIPCIQMDLGGKFQYRYAAGVYKTVNETYRASKMAFQALQDGEKSSVNKRIASYAIDNANGRSTPSSEIKSLEIGNVFKTYIVRIPYENNGAQNWGTYVKPNIIPEALQEDVPMELISKNESVVEVKAYDKGFGWRLVGKDNSSTNLILKIAGEEIYISVEVWSY